MSDRARTTILTSLVQSAASGAYTLPADVVEAHNVWQQLSQVEIPAPAQFSSQDAAASIVRAASAGEPDKVTAVELTLDAKPGSSVTTAKVVLTESDAPGSNVTAEAAKIIACPVTDGCWADGTAARWDAHQFSTDELRIRGYSNSQLVHRVGLSLGVARAR